MGERAGILFRPSERPLVRQNQIHPARQRRLEHGTGVSRRHVDENRARERVRGDGRDRFLRRGVNTTPHAREWRPRRLRGGQCLESLRRQSTRVEDVAAAIDNCDHPRLSLLAGARRVRRNLSGQLSTDLTEAEDHNIRVLRVNGSPAADLAEPERRMNRALRRAGIAPVDDDRDVELARALCDRHDVDAFVGERSE